VSIGRVEVSSTYDVWWRVEPNSEWAPRTGGEYHTVELQDGRLALVRWIGAQSDEKGMRCRSLYLGALAAGSPGLSRIDVPARQDASIDSATRDVLLGAFWRERGSSLQCACLGQTGEGLRDWLYLDLKEMEHHFGIFAQSGSGKTWAVKRILEELIVKLYSNSIRARIVIVDPNGEFRQFAEGERPLIKILEDVDGTFRGEPAYLPDASWDAWARGRLSEWQNARSAAGGTDGPAELFEPERFFKADQLLKLAVIDFQPEEKKAAAVLILEKLQRYIFSLGPYDKNNKNDKNNTLTFLVIDEAHNLVPSGSADARPPWQSQCQKIINKIAAEGRKFGMFLVMVSQSPSKIHPDALSQCANLMIMRLTRRADVDTIVDLRIDVPKELVERVSTFGQGQALFVGDFVPAPITGKIVGRVSCLLDESCNRGVDHDLLVASRVA